MIHKKERNIVYSGSVVENGADEVSGAGKTAVPDNCRPSDATEPDNGPADTGSSDGEPLNPAARPRRRTPRSEMGPQNSSGRKAPRAKSQPAISTKEIQRTNHQALTDRHAEVRGCSVASLLS